MIFSNPNNNNGKSSEITFIRNISVLFFNDKTTISESVKLLK